MRRAWLAGWLAAGCVGRSDAPGTSDAPVAEAKVAEAKVEAKVAEAKVEAPVAEAKVAEAKPPAPLERAGLAEAKALRDAGRKAARDNDWAAARAAFTAALAKAPGDASLTAELGWIEFNAGELARARALTEEALLKRPTGRSRAAQLYNFGRILEASGERDSAIKAYEASLAERSVKAVREQLAALRAVSPTGAAAPATPRVLARPEERLPCSSWQPEAALCGCLKEYATRTFEEPDVRCALKVEPLLDAAGLRVATVELGEDGVVQAFAVERGPQGAAVVLDGGIEMDPLNGTRWLGASRMTLDDGAELLRIEIETHSYGSELVDCQETYESAWSDAWMCVREKGAATPSACRLEVPLRALTVDTVACEPEDPSAMTLEVSKTRRDLRFAVDVGGDGIVRVALVEGDAGAWKGTALEPWLRVSTVPVRGPAPSL